MKDKDEKNIIFLNITQEPEFELDSPNYRTSLAINGAENYQFWGQKDYFTNIATITKGPETFLRSIDCGNSITSSSISAIDESFPKYPPVEIATLNITVDEKTETFSDIDDDHEAFKEVTEYNVECLTWQISNEKYISYANHQLLQQLDLIETRRRKV